MQVLRRSIVSRPKVSFMSRIWKNRTIYLLILPGLVWYLLFAYGPMSGLMLAFKTYKARLGVWGSPFVGLLNFEYVFRDADFMRSVWRTLSINLGRIIVQFPMPILIALMLDELRMPKYKRGLQTVLTFPHFLSWVVIASILTNFLAYDGFANSVIKALGGHTVSFLGNANIFRPLLYITEIWKSAGWSAIIYLASIAGIDVDQYEAAEIDGATRLQRMLRITLPNLKPTVIVLFILSMGNLMSAGFDQIFNLSNAAVKEASETLDMYIYRVTFQAAPDFGFSTAVSLFRSLINLVLLVLADRGARWMGGSGLIG